MSCSTCFKSRLLFEADFSLAGRISSGDYLSTHGVVRHQLESYDNFVTHLLPHIVTENSDVSTRHSGPSSMPVPNVTRVHQVSLGGTELGVRLKGPFVGVLNHILPFPKLQPAVYCHE
mmetsp:Transcript_498/g.1476  ORF Transcript_498/g.1476 Transcript_498/m.1476 type:complete len:118 (+) Transcript_498:944-1297(+)